jgi:outer membrane immunogenic protein
MSRKSIWGASLIALAMGTGTAGAADIYAPPPAASVVYNPAPVSNWTGGYVGGVVGYGWGRAKSGGTSWNADGVTGGAFGGYNFQPNSNLVLGIETDIMASGMSGKKSGVTMNNTWNGTIRGRIGLAVGGFMPYATGGLAIGGLQTKIPGSQDTNIDTGYTVGGGVEAMLTNNVIGRVEYRYTDYGTSTFATSPKTKASFSSNQVLVGVGVKF